MKNEVWKPIKNYEKEYLISNYGRVKSLNRIGTCKCDKIRKLHCDSKGYLVCNLVKNRKYKYVRVHRLVAQAFIPNPKNKPQVNHIDGNKQNNKINNLEWCTNSENQIHAIKIGLRKNENISKAKKRKINQYNLQGDFIKQWASAKDAKLFYKTSAHIYDVLNGKRKTALNSYWEYVE